MHAYPEAGSQPLPSVAAAISRALVQLTSQYTGRGPTGARTTLNTNFALVVLEETLTRGEQSLVAAGEVDAVRRQREVFHTLMREQAVAAVEAASGRTVRACLHDISPDDGVAIEVFLFEPITETGEVFVAEAHDEG
jgi:uncharacterized protein YbcI